MTFKEALAQVIDWLQQDKRVSYRALKRQFDVDDDYLEDLKEAVLYASPQVVDDGQGFVWADESSTQQPKAPGETKSENRFHAVLSAMITLLQREGRITYRTLKWTFSIDDVFLDDLLEELTLRRVAIDEEGKVLVWTGETYPVAPAAVAAPHPHVVPDATDVTSRAAHTLPPLVAEADTPEPTQAVPEAERRQLTVMFCDLADSTRLSQQLDPEDLREVVRAYQVTAAEVIAQYEGHMAQYLGDGLLVYFGWPVAHEDDAQRAAHAGLGIVEAITTHLNPRLEAEKGVQLTVRLGVHTGPVVVGEMGGGVRHENLATGETVNIAARLEGLAASNTVVISSATERLMRNAFRLEALGPQLLKGVSEPMDVFRVLNPIADHDDETVTVGVPFLVGRDEEVGLLLRRWEQSKEGLGQVVLIRGEAGIGKSSLAATVRHHVMQAGYTRIAYRCSPYHTNSALYPVIEHVQRVLQFEPGDTPATRLDKLERVLKTYSRPLEDVVPLYAALLSVPLPEGRYAALNLSPQQQRQQTQDALVGWLLEEAERQPTLAMWEDLHWADPSTLELLGLVLEQTPTVPMLHVLTFRPEFTSPWPLRSHMTPITLNRLERPQVEALITHLTDNVTLPEEVIEHIVAKTDGVPLYVEELTKMLLASKLLRKEADQYVLTGPLSTVAIPDTLQDSLMARLDQMNTAKEVAQLGAVLGREFSYDMLLAISSQDDTTLQTSLAQLVGAELLYQRGRPPRTRYIFKHALIRDAAYQSLLRSTRQHVHQQIAQMLETHFPGLVETQPELLAHHHTEAARPEPAMVYWQRAGERSVGNSAHLEALAHFTQALQVLATLPETPQRAQQELALQLALGAPLQATRGYAAPERRQAYARAWELCQQYGETSQRFPVLFGLWQVHGIRGELQTARALGEQLLGMAQDQDDSDLLLEAHRALAWTLHVQGELTQGRQHAERGIALYDPQRHHDHAFLYGQDPGMTCLVYLAWTLWLLGFPDQAAARADEAIGVAQKQSHPYSVAMAQGFKTAIHQCRREIRATQEQAEAVCELCTEQEFAFYLAWGNVLRGWALSEQEQGDAGVTQIQQGLTAFRATGSTCPQTYFLALLAQALGSVGQPAQGLTALTEALHIIEQTGEVWWKAEIYRLRGDLFLLQSPNNHTEAETCLHQALTIARQQQAKSWELRAATSLACLWQQQGKRQEAYDLLAPVYGWFTEGFDTADLKDARTLLKQLGT